MAFQEQLATSRSHTSWQSNVSAATELQVSEKIKKNPSGKCLQGSGVLLILNFNIASWSNCSWGASLELAGRMALLRLGGGEGGRGRGVTTCLPCFAKMPKPLFILML